MAHRILLIGVAIVFAAFAMIGAEMPHETISASAANPQKKAAASTPPPASPSPTPAPTLYPVVRVVDGDTIIIAKDGTNVTVRLIGLDTPEIVDPRKQVQCFGKEASDEAKKILAGQSVQIETDPSQDTYDKYGRLLAYIFLPDGTNFNEHMIAEGFGYEYTYHLPYRYQSAFKAAEVRARTNMLGLWATTTCSGKR